MISTTSCSCFVVVSTTEVVAASCLISFTSFLSSFAGVPSTFFSLSLLPSSLLADDEVFLSDLRSRSRDFSFLAIMGVTRSCMVEITE